MLLVVRPGLLVVEDGALGDPFAVALGVQLFRLGRDRRQRDALLVFTERIDALLNYLSLAQINGHVSASQKRA